MNENIIFLKINSLIADKYFETAEANMELDRGGWLSDHRHTMNCIDAEINKLLEMRNESRT